MVIGEIVKSWYLGGFYDFYKHFLKSNGEARRALKEKSISVNKEKVKDGFRISKEDLIADKFILLQRGKRNYFLLKTK